MILSPNGNMSEAADTPSELMFEVCTFSFVCYEITHAVICFLYMVTWACDVHTLFRDYVSV